MLVLCSILMLALPLAVFYAYFVRRQRALYKNVPGPKEYGILGFLTGNIDYFAKGLKKGLEYCEIVTECFEEYGKTIKLRFFNKTMLVTIDPDLVKEVLIDQNCGKEPSVYKVIGFPTGVRFVGKGLLTDFNFERWKHRRSLLNPGFHRQALTSFLDEFNSKGNVLMEHMRKLADGKTIISLLTQFNRTALDVISSVAFSMNVDSINDPTNDFNQHIYESLASLNILLIDPFHMYKPWKWPFIIRYRRVIRYLRDIGRKQILNRIEALQNDEVLPNDILTTILNTHKDEDFEIESMVDDFVTFFIAGQETTATTLAFLFLELGRNPDVLHRLRIEIDRVIGSKSFITMDDLAELKYTSACFKESLRMYPPVPGISRRTHKEIVKGDLVVPKGAWIQVSPFSSGRCESHFKLPLEFRPERFMRTENAEYSNYTYFPFSLGPRSCIGQQFAQIEGKIIIAKLIQNFDFKLDPAQSFKISQEGTIRPKDGTRCTITLRN